MSSEQLRTAATYQLTLVLGFFQRVESRLALVLGVDLSMLALLASMAPPPSKLGASALLGVFATVLLLPSLVYVWLGFFPNTESAPLEDGSASLVFFGKVAERNEGDFVAAFRAQDDDRYVRDVLGQVWTNSRILSRKFHCLKCAFLWMLVALVPWLAALAVFATERPDAKSFLP